MNSQEREYFELLVNTRQSFFDQIKEAEKVGTVTLPIKNSGMIKFLPEQRKLNIGKSNHIHVWGKVSEGKVQIYWTRYRCHT